ncbi:hypothetical protein FBY31_4140 [Arthrobacter sp. SLBN-100]|uniref:hypothetical protein n=1 Tax=Arthrobacter sp. SLBN-100 TaxID=2768450 RepID=UPI001166F909|nr:hypothetical protein [Arthrobacter sp. SLBN-100]TQJ69963.1 hypothetical protein FBY31_4140 [Arthrobacter sp. SLBN-100]
MNSLLILIPGAKRSLAWIGPVHPSRPAMAAVLALFLAACSPPAGQNGPASPDGSSSSTGSPACGLITPEIAAKVEPGLVPVGENSSARPPGSKAYQCTYSSKSKEGGMTALSVALTSPASAADISKAKSTSDCSPVTGIGDFACLQWTGYFRGEAGGASANVVLTAVRGNETLEMPYVTGPPMAGGGVPDGDAMARALSQAAVDAGWGNGGPLSVPAAPAVGAPATTNNPVCALVSPEEVQRAFGAKAPPQILPYEVSCRYTFGELGTPGPDSLIFSIEVLRGAASALVGPGARGEPLDGIGDRASYSETTEPAGPKSLRPAGDVPITMC